MARNENPPFGRGQTLFNAASALSSSTDMAHLEGKEWVFEDLDYSVPNTNTPRTSQQVRCRCVRNVSGINLLPKRIASLKLVAGKLGNQVDGYATTTGARGYPIDEWLPSTGVVNNDLFWIVVDGPAVCLTDIAAGISIAVGDYVNALTAATSQATTAGRIVLQDLTGATAPLANQVQNRIGAAMSAVTTANTNSSILVAVGKW